MEGDQLPVADSDIVTEAVGSRDSETLGVREAVDDKEMELDPDMVAVIVTDLEMDRVGVTLAVEDHDLDRDALILGVLLRVSVGVTVRLLEPDVVLD
jgi:hypothetical protein